MTDARMAIDQLGVADRQWELALRASAQAPPDEGFQARVRAIGDAAEQEAAAFRLADSLGLAWRSLPNASERQLSYELRAGGPRPGPPALWERFDTAVTELWSAMGGVALGAIARSFAELSETARELADQIADIGSQPTRRRRAG